MPRTESPFYFGRLNIIPPIHGDKEGFLLDGLQSGLILEYRRARWSFFEVEVTTHDELRFITGSLVKYKKEGTEEVVSEKEHVLTTQRVDYPVEAKARFFLHLPSLLIAFQPVANRIGLPVFLERFPAVLRASKGGFFISPEIQLVQQEYAVFEAMLAFDVITKVEIYLHPSNPDMNEDWDDVDDRIKEVGATSYKETYIGDPEAGGLKVADDRPIRAKITMAQDGYGKASVAGLIGGERRVVTTKDSPVTASAPRTATREVVLPLIVSALRGILRRFGK